MELGGLEGARVRRVDSPEDGVVAITLHKGGQSEVLLLRTGPEKPSVLLLSDRPRGRPTEGFARRLRKELEGATLVELMEGTAGVELRTRRGSDRRTLYLSTIEPWLVAILDDARAIVAGPELCRGAKKPAGLWPPRALPPLEDPRQPALSGPEAASLASRSIAMRARSERARELGRAIRQRQKALRRKLAAIHGDLVRAGEVDVLRRKATLLLSRLATLERDAIGFEAIDYGLEPPLAIRIEIDRRLGPQRQAEAWFHKARRLARGAEIARARADETKAELDRVMALGARLDTIAELDRIARTEQGHGIAGRDGGDTQARLEEIAREATALGVRGLIEPSSPRAYRRAPASRRAPAQRVPYRRFKGAGDRDVLVGRSARDNDALTLRHARPHDLFLHVRGASGSHVIVPLSRNETPSPELLLDAATLAVHFSAARDEHTADVAYTARKFVRKPKGAAAGLVLVERERVIALRMDGTRLKRLLASELR